MNLPPAFHFFKPGWWVLHLVGPGLAFGAGLALGWAPATVPPAAPARNAAITTGNPLRDEMLALKGAFDVLNESVILCRSNGIAEAFHGLHEKRAATEKGLADGTITLPRNAAQLDKFRTRDAAFHALVEEVVAAAERDELDVLKVKSAAMRDACIACHAEFRSGSDPGQERLGAVKAAIPALGTELKSKLQAAMAEGGVDAAVGVCADEAQALTRKIADERGVTIGRSSLRLRNPANQPPAWVATWLAEQGERRFEGVKGIDRIDTVDGVQMARVLRPIPIEAVCLNCHGAKESLADPVRAVLTERYPTDAAVGYAEGDLRGAVWAEAAVR